MVQISLLGIIEEVRKERESQNEKWGEQNHTPIEWLGILSEEVGEVSREVVDHHFKYPIKTPNGNYIPADEDTQAERMASYRKELVQVAAVAIQMVECLDRENKEAEIQKKKNEKLRLFDFVEKFVQPNSLICLWSKNEDSSYTLKGSEQGEMDHEVVQGIYKNYFVLGLKDMVKDPAVSGSPINIVIKT